MKKNFFIPLFWKFTLTIVVIVALFGSINIFFIRNSVYTSLENELETRGLFISKSIAEKAVTPIIYDDIVTLYKLVDRINKIDTSVAYVFILNEKNKVIAHSFEDHVPLGLTNANRLKYDGSENTILIQPQNESDKLIRDIAAPILDGKIGTVRVGLLEQNIRKNIASTINAMLIMIIIFLFAGIVGAFVFSYMITKPIKDISNIAEKIDIDSLKNEKQHRINYRSNFFAKLGKYVRIKDELDVLVTKFNNMLNRLEKTYKELQSIQSSLLQSEKLASIGTLVAGIAHEINNPIAGLQNCIRRIAQSPDNIQQNKKYLDMMAEATNNVEKVVHGLLHFSRKHDFKFQKVNMKLVIENALALATYKLEKSNISIIKEYPHFIPYIRGSSNHLEQVLLNLILNSADAINERQFEQQEISGKIIFNITSENSKLSLEIIDNGIGIPAGQINKIFDPFFTSKKVEQGTGLGLSICYNIIKEHHGEIKAETLQQGMKFTLILPICD